MSDSTERAVARALDPYAQALRGLGPSAALDARMQTAITAWAERSAVRRVWRRPLPWVVAAASVAVVAGGIALLMSRDGPRASGADATRLVTAPTQTSRFQTAPTQAADFEAAQAEGRGPADLMRHAALTSPADPARSAEPTYARVSPLAAGQVSLYPAESAIFRVKASFASAVSYPDSGDPQQGERQYWVDVRIANDGTMRIVQVIPAERGRVVPRE